MTKRFFAALILCFPFFAHAQMVQEKSNSSITVPFVGCKPDDSEFPTPSGDPVAVDLPRDIASKLAVYSSRTGVLTVLAPRGWNCTFTSHEVSEIILSPNKATGNAFQPLIELRFSDVGTPSNLLKTYGLADQFFPKVFTGPDFAPRGPVTDSHLKQVINSGHFERIGPADHLKYLNDSMVEYTTPQQTSGLGSQLLGPWDETTIPAKLLLTPYPTSGFVGLFFISNFKTPFENLKGLLTVGVRLPNNLSGLTRYILDYSEKGFENSNHLPG